MGCMLEVFNSLLSAGYVLAGALALTPSDTSASCTKRHSQENSIFLVRDALRITNAA